MTIEKANEYIKRHSPNYNIESNQRNGLMAVMYMKDGSRYYKSTKCLNNLSKASMDEAVKLFKEQEKLWQAEKI